MCGKKTLKNQPCFLPDVRCGEICNKILRCGSHSCRKDCHRPGKCEDANGQACQQPCGKPKKACGHPDLENRYVKVERTCLSHLCASLEFLGQSIDHAAT